jgi:mycothiol synthase
MSGTIRRATSDDDLAAIVAVANAAYPERGTTVEEMRWAEGQYPGGARFLAELPDGRPVGTASVGRIYVHPPEYDALWSEITVLPDVRRQGIGRGLLAAVSSVGRERGKSSLHIPASESRPEGIAFLVHRGYTEFERTKAVRLELRDLAPPPIDPPAGTSVTTLAERPDLVPGVYAVALEALPDVPGDDRMTAGDLEEFRARDVDRPGVPWDGFFVALGEAGDVLGYASILVAPGRPDVGFHDLTAVRRSARGRGIAGALKRATIGWAIERGFIGLEADNDEVNLPMRAINLRLGYRPLPDNVLMRGSTSRAIMEP